MSKSPCGAARIAAQLLCKGLRTIRRPAESKLCLPQAHGTLFAMSCTGATRTFVACVNQGTIAMLTSPMTRRSLMTAAALAFGLAAFPAQAQDTIKVGILHSLSGTMAISETTLKDVMLMLIEEQNKPRGLLVNKLAPVVVDPASNWPLFAEKARELIAKEKVAA